MNGPPSTDALSQALAASHPHSDADAEPGTPGRAVVPEHAVKALLAAHGIAVPRGQTAGDLGEVPDAAAGLTAPLVLKAFGPGLLHKSDLGAVRLGLDPTGIADAAREMTVRLNGASISPQGYLVEEQHPPGLELIVGVVRDPAFGHLVLLGLGGVATELLGVNAVRVAPLSKEDAEQLVDSFPGAPLLDGARGATPIDRAALVDLLLAVAGPEGLVNEVSEHLLELECNPVVATPAGVTALDARLILSTDRLPDPPECGGTDFTALFAPRSVAVAGASTKGSGFGNRFLAAYKDVGWTDGLVAIHPTADTIDGVPAYRSVKDVPGGVDYLVVAVPAAAAVDLVEDAAGQVQFVHVISGGFREMGADGAALEDRLLTAAAGTPTRVLGPNCIGVYSPGGRQAFTLGASREAGTVSVVSQSGGLSGDLVTVGGRRGIRYSKLVSVGNAIDVSPAELLDWLADDPETEVIGLYLEGVADGPRLAEAFRRAAATKPVVVLVGGLSRQGADAVSSHTGSMTGAPRVWRAVAESTGITLVDTLEDLMSTLAYLQRAVQGEPIDEPGVLVTGLGGGASVLATDACDRAGLELTPLRPAVREKLRAMGHGAGTSVANPVEIPIGPASPVELLHQTVRAIIEDQPFGDVLAHVNVAAYYSYGTKGVAPLLDALREVASAGLPTRLAVVTRNLVVATPEDAAALAAFSATTGLPLFGSFDEAATAIAAAQRFAATARRDLR